MVKITFYNRNKNLGTFKCPEQSSQEVRNAIASSNGIGVYTRFVLDDGRVTGWVKGGELVYFQREGESKRIALHKA